MIRPPYHEPPPPPPPPPPPRASGVTSLPLFSACPFAYIFSHTQSCPPRRPGCVAFGSGDFGKVFSDFNPTENFLIAPAVRHAAGPCVDEANCNFEKVTLCAFNQTKVGQAGVSTRADFLICIDETKETNDAVAAATPCAAKSSLDMPTIKTCYNGAQGMALLTTASTLWNHYFPSPTTIPKVRAAGTALSLSLERECAMVIFSAALFRSSLLVVFFVFVLVR